MKIFNSRQNIFSVLVLLVFFQTSLTGCKAVEALLNSIRYSSLSGKNLDVLVIPPMEKGSKEFESDVYNQQLKKFMLEGIQSTDKLYRHKVSGYHFENMETIKEFYKLMNSTANRALREEFLSLIAKNSNFSQIMFGVYDYSGRRVGLRIYLFDPDEKTIGKNPDSGLIWFNWNYRKEVSNRVSNQVATLIRNHF